MRQRKPVLKQLFALQTDFDILIASYSMLLSLLELAHDAAKAKPTDLTNLEDIRFEVPALFIGVSRETLAIASRRIFGNRSVIERVAERSGAKSSAMRAMWPPWKKLMLRFRRDVFDRWAFDDDLPIADLA